MKRFTLLARFSVISLVLFIVIGLLLGFGLSEFFKRQAIDQHATEVSELVVPLISPYLTDQKVFWTGAKTDTQYHAIESALSLLSGTNLVRVKIWNKQGMIIYSDKRELIGQKFPVEEKLATALQQGSVSADISEPDKAENIEERGFGTLLEVYAPLPKEGAVDSPPIGAFEGYFDVQDMKDNIDRTDGYMWASIITGFLFLYISLFTLVRDASRRILRQSHENSVLLADTERKAARLQLVNDLARSINQSSLNLDQVFQTALRGIDRIVKHNGAGIILLDEHTGEALSRVDSPSPPAENGASVGRHLDADAQRRLLGGEDTFVCPDTQQSTDTSVRHLADHGVRSLLLVSIGLGERRLGLLSVTGSVPRAFDGEDAAILKGVADQLAVAIENHRLIEETAETTALRETNRLKDEFVSMVSHELRTPLASIKGYSRTLLADGPSWDDETSREFLATISEESDKLTELVENLLEMSRIEAGRVPITPEPLLMPHFCKEVVERVSKLYPQIPFECDLPEGLPLVMADPRRVEQVLANLLQNAAKYSQSPMVRVDATHDHPGEVAISVQDKGVGIPPEHLSHIFDKFYRIEHRGQLNGESGTGLGLAIARALVEAQGGRIWVESQAGVGTTFFFTLPTFKLGEDESEPEPEAEPTLSAS